MRQLRTMNRTRNRIINWKKLILLENFLLWLFKLRVNWMVTALDVTFSFKGKMLIDSLFYHKKSKSVVKRSHSLVEIYSKK